MGFLAILNERIGRGERDTPLGPPRMRRESSAPPLVRKRKTVTTLHGFAEGGQYAGRRVVGVDVARCLDRLEVEW